MDLIIFFLSVSAILIIVRIAEILGVSQSGLSTFLKRFNQRENCENEKRSSRPRKTDDRGDTKISLYILVYTNVRGYVCSQSEWCGSYELFSL
jgi:predicted transcriptional regulator